MTKLQYYNFELISLLSLNVVRFSGEIAKYVRFSDVM